ncbi:MAG: D-amino-acid transaminase [Alphaproteobacteria bacterium]|nr:D-amino-acid transaminase [Alphaproteobacteria bacterium]MBL6936405.1 D-amino-acid transaminase [Alphaproteobacteria bacterium]MBL7098544.1 D-amino-acid transaminase [Alphaproteobacteria bacterium]
MSKGWNGRAPAGRVAYVNGRYVPHGHAGVHIEDRGFQLGDAVYEVCAVVDGALMDEEEHLDRLVRSVGEIEMAMPMPRNALKLVLREVVRRNGVQDGLLYLQVTRGAVRRDHPIPDKQPRPSLVITARSWDVGGAKKRHDDGIAVISAPDERWGRVDIKTVQLLPNLLAKTAARRAGAYEAWLVDRDGMVTEGSSTTAWIVDAQGRLTTRNLTRAVLPGVTRRVILEAAAAAQLPVREVAFSLTDAQAAKEAFISSATGIVPVTKIDGQTLGDGRPGPLTRRVQELYEAESERRAKGL